MVSLEPLVWNSRADNSGELARRLITLIFAGRNRMVMIRRELPRTENAGWVRKPYRREDREDSPSRGPFTVIGAAVPNLTFLLPFGAVYAAAFFAHCFSTCTPMAQMNPSSSLPNAVMI